MQMGIVGICGKMGNQCAKFYQNRFEVIGIDVKQHPDFPTYSDLNEISHLDVLVDFSSPSAYPLLKEALERKIPVLSGTTGYSTEEIETLKAQAKQAHTTFLWSANYAKGISLFVKLIEECQKEFQIFDFVEIHATTKKDAPSGTAKMFARKMGIPEEKIQSLRLYQAPAIHELIFASEDERIIIRHEVIHKQAFILGFDEVLKKVLGGQNVGDID